LIPESSIPLAYPVPALPPFSIHRVFALGLVAFLGAFRDAGGIDSFSTTLAARRQLPFLGASAALPLPARSLMA